MLGSLVESGITMVKYDKGEYYLNYTIVKI